MDKGGTLVLLILAVWYFNNKVNQMSKQYQDLLTKYEELLIKVGGIDLIKTLETIIDKKFSQIIEIIMKKP
jgi:hypothetical protein